MGGRRRPAGGGQDEGGEQDQERGHGLCYIGAPHLKKESTAVAAFTQEEIGSFLGEPRIGHLVTVRAAGTPHVAPVWFLWDSQKAWVIADAQAVKNSQHPEQS